MYRQPERQRNAPRRTSAVLLDLDDTLFDQRRAVRGGLDAIGARFDAIRRVPFERLLETHDLLLDQLHLDVLRGQLSVNEARRIRIAIVSNNTRDEQLGKLQACRLDDLVDAFVFWEDARIAKPDPAMFRLSLERLGAAADEAVVVGDSWSADVMGAIAAGIRAVWLNRRGNECPDPGLATEIRALEPTETVARVILASTPGPKAGPTSFL